MIRVRLKRLASALVVALVLLSASTAGSGTVSKTFPDLNEHVRMFLEFKLAMTQREFRARVPMGWRVVSFFPDLGQNIDYRGEVDLGKFAYHFVARGTQYPITRFYFSDGKIIYADLTSQTDEKQGIQAHYAALFATKTLQAIHGITLSEDTKKDGYSAKWSNADADISVRFAERDNPVARFTLTIQVPGKYWAWFDWYYRGAIARKGKGPLTTLYCTMSDPDSAHKNFHMLVDTREWTVKQAQEFIQHNAGGQGHFHCEGGIVDDASEDAVANAFLAKRRQPRTYLHAVKHDGLIYILRFPYAGIDIEDSVCEEYLAGVNPAKYPDAECITGTDVWQHGL